MKNNKNTVFITFLFAAMLWLNACTQMNTSNPWNIPTTQTPNTNVPVNVPTPVTNNGQQSINVALLLPLTGRNAALGQSMLQSAQMALFEINNPILNLVPRDTKGTASGAQMAAQSAIGDGAQLIIGPVFADAVRAVKPLARQSNLNIIAFSTDQSLADPNTFLMGLMPTTQANVIANHATKSGLTNISIIAPRGAYGDIVTTAFDKTARQNGATIQQIVRYASNDPDLGSNINAMTSNIDAVFMPAGGAEARAISDYLDQNNMPTSKVRRLGTGLWENPTIVRLPSLDGGQFANPSPQNRNYFDQKYQNTYGTKPVRIASLSFDATALAAKLIQNAQRAGSPNPFTQSAITNINGFAGTDGILRFNRNGIVERKLSILELRNATIVEIAPAARQF